MLLNKTIVAILMASASTVLALPRPNTISLSVRADDDDGIEYKRAAYETFVCKRDDNQSLSCLRKREPGDAADQSKTAGG